jgi:hypothetical protein
MQRMKKKPSHRHHKAHRTTVQAQNTQRQGQLYDQRINCTRKFGGTLLALYSNIDTIGRDFDIIRNANSIPFGFCMMTFGKADVK